MRFARVHSRSYCGRRNWFRWNTAFAHIENRCIRQSLKSRIAEVTCAKNSSLKWLSLKWRALKSLAPHKGVSCSSTRCTVHHYGTAGASDARTARSGVPATYTGDNLYLVVLISEVTKRIYFKESVSSALMSSSKISAQSMYSPCISRSVSRCSLCLCLARAYLAQVGPG